MTFIVVRARSDVKVERSIRETMGYMNLTRQPRRDHSRQPAVQGYASEGQGLHHLGRSRCRNG